MNKPWACRDLWRPGNQKCMDPRHLDEAMPRPMPCWCACCNPNASPEAQVVAGQPVNWTARVQTAFAQHGDQGPWPEADDIAQKLRCSERTLRRHLAEEGALSNLCLTPLDRNGPLGGSAARPL